MTPAFLPTLSRPVRRAVAALLCGLAVAAQAAPLKLFDLDLADAGLDTFRQAARAAGAQPAGSRGATELYTVAGLGLPGIRTMELTPWRGRVMSVQYTHEDFRQEEALRRMLVAKYGEPTAHEDHGFGGARRSFAGEYVGDGRYAWRFDGGMELVFRKPFSGRPTLSYVNTGLLKQAESAAERRAGEAAAQAAARESSKF